MIFIVVPGSIAAQRIAGKNATPQNIINILSTEFDKPFCEQYFVMVQKMFWQLARPPPSQQGVDLPDRRDIPKTFSPTISMAHHPDFARFSWG